MFYAQSTITVISGHYTFCRYTISFKNMSMLKTYVFRFFLNSCKKWVKHKLKTFSQLYIRFLKSIQKTNHLTNVKHKSMYKNQTSIFKPLVPSILPLLRERIRLRTCWHHRPLRLIYQYQVKEKYLKKRNGWIQN